MGLGSLCNTSHVTVNAAAAIFLLNPHSLRVSAVLWWAYLSVCPSVYVCKLAYLVNHTSKHHQIFCASVPWLRLGPSVVALRYVRYSSFVDDVMSVHNRPGWGGTSQASTQSNSQESSTDLTLWRIVWLTRHRPAPERGGGAWCLQLPCFYEKLI